MNRFAQFFEDDEHHLSSARLYSFVALITAVILTFSGGSYEMTLTWLMAAFTGKVASKLTENKVDKPK